MGELASNAKSICPWEIRYQICASCAKQENNNMNNNNNNMEKWAIPHYCGS